MHLRVSSPGITLRDGDVDRIQKDLDKIDRRLHRFEEVYAAVRINGSETPGNSHHVTLEVEYGRHHLVATADGADLGQTVRAARDEILRQINDRSRGSHSEYAKKR
jgi:ribosome-associated translation inhibitor RaiA